MSFVHLHVHSQYSLLESTIDLEDLCKQAKAYEMPAVALTDFGNMFGAVEFYFAALSAGVKPILGLEVYIAPKSRHERGENKDQSRTPNRRMVLLAKNFQGYQNLCRLSSLSYREGFYYKPRVDFELLEKYNSDLICLSGGWMGEVPWNFRTFGAEVAEEKIKQLATLYPGNFYLELNRTGINEWNNINAFLIEMSKKHSLPLVAGNDVHYLKREDQVPQEVLICIGSNKLLSDDSRFKLGTDQFYFKSPQEMQKLFADVPEALENTVKIADACNIKFQLKDANGKPIYHLPSYPTQGGRSATAEIKVLSEQGLQKRFQEAAKRNETVPDSEHPIYFERLAYELSVIDKMGFNGYFLIVQDFIGWAKANNIPVGPGRGSGAGSLVAYSLGITDLDPISNKLIFERFLNPERISMPDFDVDFCMDNRGKVIDYVTQKYGEASVSQIITYGKLQTRAAIRDVGRVLGMTFSEVDVVTKLIPEKLGITLKEAIDTEPRLRDLMENDPKISSLMDLAQKIEGLVRHAGIHAAGVIIADGEIVNHAPLYRGTEGENVVQFDMKYAEKIGLIKFDFLGLKTLTHIDEALKLVEKNRGVKIKPEDISVKDPGVYQVMSKGDTAGVFQFEGEGITDLLRKQQPTVFEDIVAANALYRPGPMDMIPEYLDRKKNPEKIKYVFPELEEILKETYGIIVYQEQVQLIASKIANYSLGEADVLRRAMGKKIAEEMKSQRERFMSGAKELNFDPKKSGELFDLMAKFAEYGFNKSHAAAYCVIAAQTAYLKCYYPVEFFAALLSTETGDTDKVVKYVKDAKKHSYNGEPIEVEAPHINYSDFKFSVKGNKIYFSLGAIKGVGQAAVEAIVEAREKLEGKKFQSLEQFFEVVDLRRVNKKTIEALIKAGAMDGFGFHRNQLFMGYSQFIDFAEGVKEQAEIGQGSLFSLDEDMKEAEGVSLPETQSWSRSSELAFEKEVLGFYLSGHPLLGIDQWTETVGAKKVSDLATIELKPPPEFKGPPSRGPRDRGNQVRVFGMLQTLREVITKKGSRMAFGQLEDLTGTIELVIFPNAYAEFAPLLLLDRPLIVQGSLEREDEAQKILVDKIQDFETVAAKTDKIILNISPEVQGKLALVQEVLKKHPGETKVFFRMNLPELNTKVDLKSDDGVTVTRDMIEGLRSAVGPSEAKDFFFLQS